MRVSTLQMHQQSLSTMQRQQANVQHSEIQIASGLKIMKPSDDPSGAVKVLNLTANIEKVDQYSRNISTATSSLAFEENVITSINTNLQRIRELTVQGNNASNPDAAKNNIAQEIYQRLDEMISLSNTRDAAGQYIFAGYKTGSPPFVDDGTNVSYQGDIGQQMVQIGDGSQVTIRDSGEHVFQRIPSGDGRIEVSSNPANTGTLLVGEFGIDGSFIADNYTVNFIQASTSAPITYEVINSSGATVDSGTYAENRSIGFAGAQFAVTGIPENGDSVSLRPSRNQDVFTTIRNIADALARPAPTAPVKAQFQNEMGQGLANLDQALSNMTTIRASIGARLNNIETLDGINQDFKLQLEGVLSDTQDLDYAEAISRFNLELTSLQAAQQAFVKTSNLSLFQYL